MTSNIIKFILNDKVHEIHNPDPNETILLFFRSPNTTVHAPQPPSAQPSLVPVFFNLRRT